VKDGGEQREGRGRARGGGGEQRRGEQSRIEGE